MNNYNICSHYEVNKSNNEAEFYEKILSVKHYDYYKTSQALLLYILFNARFQLYRLKIWKIFTSKLESQPLSSIVKQTIEFSEFQSNYISVFLTYGELRWSLDLSHASFQRNIVKRVCTIPMDYVCFWHSNFMIGYW